MEYKDYYGILGVSRDASQDEIQREYKKLARKLHPDVSKEDDAEDRFKELGQAYDVLKDSEKRKLYDQYGESWKAISEGRQPPPSAGGGSFDFRDLSGVGFDGQFDPNDLGALFETLFGGAYAGQRSMAGMSQEAELVLDIEEAFAGGQRQLSLTDPQTGVVKSLMVNVPAGVRPGQRIRLAGQGGPGVGDGPPGDLFLRVRIRPDDRYRLEGSNVHVALAVAPWEAALGTTKTLETLDGSVRVKVPAGSSSGRKIRLKNRGYPKSSTERGHLLAELRIDIPEELSARERELYEELARLAEEPAHVEAA